ncbi:dual specificity phosphatase [Sclerotinia borealis F-4128]|uniref:phosphatidylinositol-3,4,5-trisphosphate 3-phosphatase n=1 Tax=Sclerotinia borealis (strain F-4128) TaxID=1432307 RepID=W9C3N3_SCLBF|nr:dual specificity phosphatase [Sclerotinia borealis F-4128]
MASLLRQIVAGPRSRHPEAGLDLCYVTHNIIATSGPSGTYPQRAYRNPLDQLVTFLDYKHGSEGWMIWEFRAEGTGYPDEEVRGRVKHWPWPDHHPPPFKLVPGIVGGMSNWLEGMGDGEGGGRKEGGKEEGKVVVVHCKAGKGRSGTMACSYLIAECGWKASDALARFTERRMRPGFGQGVSIPSQLRWVGYVDRWTQSGKHYIDRQIEIMEVHVWGLRDGVKVQVEGYVDEGKTIKLFHVFTKKERVVVEGNTPGSGGIKNMLSDMAGFGIQDKIGTSKSADLIEEPKHTKPILRAMEPNTGESSGSDSETGGGAVIFKPSTRVILPTSDINIDFERRNKASMGWTMVTAVAHVWFNAYFEGNGPENGGLPAENGLFEIEWDKMDGIKGSSRKGTRAFDKLAVVWKIYDPEPGHSKPESIIDEPDIDSPVPDVQAADWKGENEVSTSHDHGERDLGLRTESPASAEVSKASSVIEVDKEEQEEARKISDSEEGLRVSSPTGEEELELGLGLDVDLERLPKPEGNASVPDIEAVNSGLDTASKTTVNYGAAGK